MTTSNLFTAEGLAAVAGYLSLDTLLAFDLDGTLAPIVADHDKAMVPEPVRQTLKRLMGVSSVAVITGRSRKDALAILGFEPHLLVGNHGAEWPSAKNTRDWQKIRLCLRWRERLQDMLGYVNGIEIEFKGESIAVHYRKSDIPAESMVRILEAVEKLEPKPRVIGGKFVVNLLSPDSLTKGESLLASMRKCGARKAIYFGDDETDEDVFRLDTTDILGIHIGYDRMTSATYYLEKQSDLLGLLNSMVGMLETCGSSESETKMPLGCC